MTVYTDENGEFTFSNVAGDFTVTPVLEGYSFVPGSQSVSVEPLEILSGVDFDASIYWHKAYGGIGEERAYSVQQTIDGGYIVACRTEPFGAGSEDIWLIKTDKYGIEEWDRTFGGLEADSPYSVQQTIDGGYIVAGRTASYGAGEDDFWLIKTDKSGNEEWNRTFGGVNTDCAYSVQQTPDHGYIVAGRTASFGAGKTDFWLIKTDGSGNEEWNKTYGGIYHESAHSVRQTADGGYIVSGDTQYDEAGADDIWLVKTDESGNEVWNRTFGGVEQETPSLSVQQTSDGGYIVSGATGDDMVLIKTDGAGYSYPVP